MKETIKQLIQTALKNLSIETEKVGVEHALDLTHGDYASNIALALAKQEKSKPLDLAKKIADEIEKIKPVEIETISVAGAGYINFTLSKDYFTQKTVDIISRGDSFGKNSRLKDEKIIIEYTDPNPFKQFHIGHIMANTIGESLATIIEWSGAEVKRVCYQGDVGLHIAKTMWAMKQAKTIPLNATAAEKTEFLGTAYVEGSKSYEDNKEVQAEVKKINKHIFEKTDPEVNELYEWGRKVSLDHFEEIYAKLGTKFDQYFFESEMAPIGMFIVEELVGKGILEKSDGAVVFKGEQYGLHTRVFVNSEGLPTYETKELGLHKKKYEWYQFDRSIVVTGNEQNDYFKVLMKVMEFAYSTIANKTRHISHGMLRFSEGKMSSRSGNIITGESLLAQIEEVVTEKIKDRELSSAEKKQIAEVVGVAAIKYSVLRQAIGKDIIFEFEKSLSFEGDSGPYLQYAATRAGSVLAKALKEGIETAVKPGAVSRPEKLFDFERKLGRFPEIVERAETDLAPQHIATYLIDLAGSFNNFYAEEQIVLASDETSAYKVALTEAFRVVMKNGLHLLGIRMPEKM